MNISPRVSVFFRRAMFALAVAFVSGGAVFLVQRGSAESLSGATAFQAADMGAKSVRDEMKKLDGGDPIARLGGSCDDGVISGKNSSGNYLVTFRDGSGRPMECSETIGKISAVEVTGIFGSEKRVIRVAVAEATVIDNANNYLTTGSESQYKKGALGIGGLLKAYLGINANAQRITNVASPVESSDAATKSYVDGANVSSAGAIIGMTGGYVTTTVSDGRFTSCSAWGKGGANCRAETGYSCGQTGGTESAGGINSFFVCVRNE